MKHGNQRKFTYTVSPSKQWFRNRIYSLLRRSDARWSADIILPLRLCDAYRYFAGQALLMTSQSRSCTKCLFPTDKIIVLNCYFNVMKQSNLIDRL